VKRKKKAASTPPEKPKEGWKPVSPPPVEEWQVCFGHRVVVFHHEAKAKAFVEGLKPPWDRNGFSVEILVRHVLKHPPDPPMLFQFVKSEEKS
jgi:hypothetical protein